MRAITEERVGAETAFRIMVPNDKASAVRKMLESMMVLMGEVSMTVSLDDVEPDVPPGPMLKRLRKENGLSQKALAEKLGTNQVRVSDMEQGVRAIPPEMAMKMAEVFGVSAKFFWSNARVKSRRLCRPAARPQACRQVSQWWGVSRYTISRALQGLCDA